MNKSRILIWIILIVSLSACKSKEKQSTVDDSPQNRTSIISPAQMDSEKIKARSVCEKWMKIIDQKDFTSAYKRTSVYFKTTVPIEDWKKFQSGLKVYGLLSKRKFIAAEFFQGKAENKTFEYIVCKFQSSFTKKTSRVETISVIKEANEWKIMGYFID